MQPIKSDNKNFKTPDPVTQTHSNSTPKQVYKNRYGRYAITGIGKKLDVSDIGKNFVRTFPYRSYPDRLDWSFMPNTVKINGTGMQLIRIKKDSLIFSDDFFSKRKVKWLDDNWIEAERYEAAVNAVLETTTATLQENDNWIEPERHKEPVKAILETATRVEKKREFINDDEVVNKREKPFFPNVEVPSEPTKPISFPNSTPKQVYMDKYGRYAITGIGKKLDENDIGKNFVRTFPYNSDWSYMPHTVHERGMQLIGINKDYLLFFHSSKRKVRLIDDNWIEADRYEEAFNAVLETATPEEIREFISNDDIFTKKEKHFSPNVKVPMSEPTKPFLKTSEADIPETKFEAKRSTWKKEEEAWLKNLLKRPLKETLSKDYTLPISLNEPIENPYRNQVIEPDFNSDDPRKVLGLGFDETKQDTIKKQYRRLALKNHPDKGGDPNIFKKIATAYNTLLNEIEVTPFIVDLSLNGEENYQLAFEFYVQLDTKKYKLEDRIAKFEIFSEEIENLQKHPEMASNQVIKLLTDRLILKTKNCLSFYKISKNMQNIVMPIETMPLAEKIIHLKEAIKKLDDLKLEYNLTNSKESWLYETLPCYKFAYRHLADKSISFRRSLAELYAANNENTELLKLREDSLIFHSKFKQELKEGCLKAEASEREFNLNLMKHSPQKPQHEEFEKKQTPSNDGSSIPENQKPSEKGIDESGTIDSNPQPEKLQVKDPIESNIKKNMQYFKLSP